MKREIKFRLWDSENSESPRMQYCDNLQVCDNGLFFEMSKFDLGGGHNDTDNPFIMQFTGLKDKNGNDIYEGDILKEITNACAHDFKAQFNELCEFWEVEWDERTNGFNSFPIASKSVDVDKAVEQLGGQILWPNSSVLATPWHYEIIGNIHTTPELLKN